MNRSPCECSRRSGWSPFGTPFCRRLCLRGRVAVLGERPLLNPRRVLTTFPETLVWADRDGECGRTPRSHGPWTHRWEEVRLEIRVNSPVCMNLHGLPVLSVVVASTPCRDRRLRRLVLRSRTQEPLPPGVPEVVDQFQDLLFSFQTQSPAENLRVWGCPRGRCTVGVGDRSPVFNSPRVRTCVFVLSGPTYSGTRTFVDVDTSALVGVWFVDLSYTLGCVVRGPRVPWVGGSPSCTWTYSGDT